MRYYVYGSDGNKYGPADVPTLNVWMQEGRLRPDTMLEEEGTGRKLTAGELGVGAQQQQTYQPQQPQQPQQTPYQPGPGASPYSNPPQPGSPYPRGYGAPSQGNTQTLIVIGWICAVISLCFCPIVFGAVGIVMGVLAQQRGDPRGKPLMIGAIVLMVAGFVLGFVLGMSNFFGQL